MEEVLDNAVQMRIDIHDGNTGHVFGKSGQVPKYRLYINEELFSERLWKFEPGEYLSEQLFVKKQPGTYRITIESLSEQRFKLRNLRCAYGKAEVVNNEVFKL